MPHVVPAGPSISNDLPRPILHRSSWRAYLIWLVPLAALIIAGFYLRSRRADHGPEIVIRVETADGMRPDQTMLRCHGVEVGRVTRTELADNQTSALVHVTLRREANAFANEGTQFWVVRPDFSGGSISGLGTVLTGPYIEAIAGDGKPAQEFAALPNAPSTSADAFKFQLLASDLRHVGPGTSIRYRGVEVGNITAARLAEDATHVTLDANVQRRYAPLVRQNSVFWVEAPVDIKGGIFSGIEAKVGTLSSLFSGSVRFASPNDPLGEPAFENGAFTLLEDAPKNAEEWQPKITIDPADANEKPAEAIPTTQQAGNK